MDEPQRTINLVTGVSSGIGEAVARKIIAKGGFVFGVSRRQPRWARGNDVKNFHWIEADLLDSSSSSLIANTIYEHSGHLDSVVNAAGILSSVQLSQETPKEWDEILTCNLSACFFLIQNCIDLLTKGEGKAVVNISSNAGRMGGVSNSVAYAASKGGVIAMTYSLARKLAEQGVRVNCVAPGPVDTDMFNSFSEEKRSSVSSAIPLNRIGLPDEVADAVLFLISKKSSFITGATLDVNGGLFTG
jgi:3-oxoacyl-[acyl-carrier protein] reductase